MATDISLFAELHTDEGWQPTPAPAPPPAMPSPTGAPGFHVPAYFEGENVEPTDLKYDYIEVLPAGLGGFPNTLDDCFEITGEGTVLMALDKVTDAGVCISKSSRTGNSRGVARGFSIVTIAIPAITTSSVIACRLRNAISLNCHCKNPYTGTDSSNPVTPAADGAFFTNHPNPNAARIPGEIYP